MGDSYRIKTVDRLRERMGQPSEFVTGKVNDFLDDFARDYIAGSPFLVLAARGQDALLAIRVTVDECFFHCAKAFRRSELWKPETWKPKKVSMGAMFARRIDRDGDRDLIDNVDAAIEQNYRDEL